MSAPTLAQKVSNIKHMPVLLAATSATKDPADGYLVKDIIKMSYESYQTRLFLLQYLVNQLITSSNVYSKIKILRLFLVLLEDGHVEFKQTLRKTPEPFSEAAKLRPHQPKDQKLVSECGRIRDMANKVLDVLFSEVPEMRSRPNPVSDTTSYGDGSGSGGGGHGGSRITGFGNTPSPKTSIKSDKLKSLFGTSGKSNLVVYDPDYATMDPVPHNASSSSTYSVHAPNTGSASRYQGNDGVPSGLPHARGQAGGGWSTGNQTTGYKQGSGYYSQEKEEEREDLSSTGEDLSSYGQTGIEQEQRIVDDITAPGGVRAAPPKKSLDEFVGRCKVLDALSVVDCLRLKLLSEESQTVLRALFVIEALLRSDIPDMLSHLDIVLQDLSDLTSSPNSSIQAKAKKILVQLTATNAERVPSLPVGTHRQEDVAEEPDGEEPDEGDSSGVASIFSGLSVSGHQSSQPAKRNKKKPKLPSTAAHVAPKTKPSPTSARREAGDSRSGFGDILGLGDLSAATSSEDTVTQEEREMEAQEPLMATAEEDNSLLTFEEEDLEFDPLKRSDSLGLTKSGSISKRPLSNQNALELSSEPKPPPMTSRESLGHIQDLTGIDLTAASSTASPPILTSQLQQEGHGNMMLHPFHPTTAGSVAPVNLMVASSAGVMPHAGIQLVSATPGGSLQGGVAYGGGAPTVVPMVYAAQGNTGMMYQPQFGGTARPVQRAAVSSKEQTPPPDTGFSFLGKSNKSSAFDFVQDEMKATRTKK